MTYLTVSLCPYYRSGVNVEPPYDTFGCAAGAARNWLLVLLLIVTAGCQTGPPVQEMSDARQAIAVAKEAGAAQLAAEELRAAEEHLHDAEESLIDKAYAQARRAALQAKRSAMSALSISENAESMDPD